MPALSALAYRGFVMDWFSRSLRKFCATGAGLSMALVFAILFFNALARYTIGKSVPWGEELPIYLTIYGVMFGIGYAYALDTHIRFTLFADMMPKKIAHFFALIGDFACAFTGLALAVSGIQFAMRRGDLASSGLKSTADWLAQITNIELLKWLGKVGTWQFAVTLGGVLLFFVASTKFFQRVTGKIEEAK